MDKIKRLEERVLELERRLDRMEPHINHLIPLGPNINDAKRIKQRSDLIFQEMLKTLKLLEGK